MSQEKTTISPEEVLVELSRRVEQRRQEGKYPPGLESQLQAEFESILEVVHRGSDEIAKMTALLTALREEVAAVNGVIDPASQIPFGRAVHRLAGKVVGRQTKGLALQVQSTLTRHLDLLEMMLHQFRIQRDSDVRVLHQLEAAMHDRLMMIDALAESLIEIERKLSDRQI